MKASQGRKRVAGYLASLFLLFFALPFEKFSSIIIELDGEDVTTSKQTVSTRIDDYYSSFIVPKVPDIYPTEMISKAFVPRNTSLPATTYTTVWCSVTSQVRVLQRHDDSHWIIQSLDINGSPKRIGGDEYYVTYTDNTMATTTPKQHSPTAVAFVTDLEDGSYKLDFVTSPSLTALQSISTALSGRGTLTIILQYSCGLGHLAPPFKENWSTGGAMNAKYVVDNVTAPRRIQEFVAPHDRNIDFGQYNRVVAYGDSTMGHFCHRNLIWPAGNIGAPLNTETVFYPRERKGITSPSFVEQITHEIKLAREEYGDNIALLMGSGVWDVLSDVKGQGVKFHNHRRALRELIAAIREEFPTLDMYWKSVTAMHIHQVASRDDWWELTRVFYMSSSRTHDLYRYQKEIMKELNVPVLDLYNATYLSAEQLQFADGRHFSPEFNKLMLNWFYKD